MIDVSKIAPTKDSVVVKLIVSKFLSEGLFVKEYSDATDVAPRFGEVIVLGPAATQLEHCPALCVSDIVMFTEFAGYYIASDDKDNIYKVIRAYDIIGKFMKETEIEERDKVIPAGNRVLVEVMDVTKHQDGIIFNAKDPKLADLTYGKVLKVNGLINKSSLQEDKLVAFPPYVGTTIRHYESEDRKELRIIVEEDILFTV